MGQLLSAVNSQIIDLIQSDQSTYSSASDREDVNLFLSIADTTNTENCWIKQIQKTLFQLTNVSDLELISAQNDTTLMANILMSITDDYKRVIQEIKCILERQEQIKSSLTEKLDEDKKQHNNHGRQGHLSFGSKISTLFKFAERNISIAVHHLFEPEKKGVEEITTSNTRSVEKQLENILSNFSPTTALFKNILPILNQLIFDSVNVYDVRDLFIELNKSAEGISSDPLTYLTLIGAYPNHSLKRLHKKQFTGQFISLFLLVHIDSHDTINATQHWTSGTINSSISFEFHPQTFKQLFDIIKQLTMTTEVDLNANLVHILTICLRLFTTHLKFLRTMTTKLHRDLLITNENIRTTVEVLSAASNKEIDLMAFATDDELRTWLDTLLILACNDQRKSEQITICREASKAFIQIFDQKTFSFIEKLSFIHKYIAENKHLIFIEQLLIELNTDVASLSWIEVLCDIDDGKSDKATAFTILYSLMDIYLNPPSDTRTQHIEQVLQTFQKLVFARLMSELGSTASSLATNYISYILRNSNGKLAIMNDILLGLCLMTETQQKFNFAVIQPIFGSILPLIADFALQNTTNQEFIYCLLGKMSRVLVTGSAQNSLEMKYVEKLQSPLFAGGCENNQSSLDQEFLMSIFNNMDQGAQLISKMKLHMKDKRCLLQKSIEQQANQACAALFAVYIKHFRRINLAKSELSQTDDQKPHPKLLSIFEYANRIQTLFATTKGQGGDCNELYEQIKIKARFLLISIKESHWIPIVECLTNTPVEQGRVMSLKRQCSRKEIQKPAFRLLRNMVRACIRFKRLTLTKKKAIELKPDNENILHRAIDTYVCDGNTAASNELIGCMTRQHERAMIRLITYRFIHTFIEKVLNMEDKNRVVSFLTIYLPFLRNMNLEWSYLENIPAVNIQLKEDIGNGYYSIIKIILSYLLQSTNIEQTIIARNIFNLLNLSYQSVDIHYLHRYEFLGTLFTTFVSCVKTSDQPILVDMKLIGYHWFRLYVFKLCENSPSNQEFVFGKLIFNELNGSAEKVDVSSKFEIELASNQWLMLLLRCVHLYEHVRSICATIEYIEKLLDIYRNSQNQTKILLALKILRKLILFLPESADGKSKTMVTNFLNEILLSQRITSDIFTELIYIYRTIISHKSPWQIMGTRMIFDAITEPVKSFETNQMSNVIAALCVLGGYVQYFCLGSVVQVYVNDEMDNETQLAVIMEINGNSRDSGTLDARPYFIHYAETNQTEWVSADRLRVQIDVPTPNLLTLPIANEDIHALLDGLVYFIQIDTSLELKRRSVATFYRILNNKKLVEIFMQKPYASIIAKLSISDLLSKNQQQPTDLRLWNKRHLEQYCLSLDRCESSKQIIEDMNITSEDKSMFTVWTDASFKRERLVVDLLSNTVSKCYQWKPNASKREIQMFKRGRIGNEEIRIVPMSAQLSDKWLLEDCGIVHRFPGRIYLISETSAASLVTFTVDNLRLNEGKWYYCVRLLEGTFAQIGWATTGFNPSSTIGIGNDQYSWSYDGSQGMLYNNGQYPFLSSDVRWSTSDVCGCGIEIEDDQTRINYWLNGHFLGTAFAHQFPIGLSTTICDMSPNAHATTYFPGVSLKVNDTSVLSSCEFIFSPEDMIECPLPNGYKPLLIPTLGNSDDSLVPYPYSAYLVGDHVQDYIHKTREVNSATLLRDFVNGHHLTTTLTCHNHQLILPENSGGFPLTIDHHESLTISLDFQILTPLETDEIVLLTFDTPDRISIRIPTNKINHQTRTAIVFYPDDHQIKIYINNECRTFESPAIIQFNVSILSTMAAGIQNLAIWKYALSEEHIRRLFTSGLSYVALDYRRLNEHRKQANTFTFTGHQQYFANELLVPLSEPFDETKWEQVKKEADKDESNYFKPINGIDQSTIQLFGNKTYLVLEKSIGLWSEYTLILDVFIDHLPIMNEQVTLVTLNTQSHISITHDGQLCLSISNQTKIQSKPTLKLNEFIRMLVSVEQKSIKIYTNGLLELSISVEGDQLTIIDKKIELFRDSTGNTTGDDTLRLECKSITYLNRATDTINDQMKSPHCSLETLVAVPYSVVAPSLILIGYDELQIKSAVDQNPTVNIQLLDTILRGTIQWKFGQSIDKKKLEDLLKMTEFDTDEKIAILADGMLIHWNEIQMSPLPLADKPWFSPGVHHLNIDSDLFHWIQDKSPTLEDKDLTHQLLEFDQPAQDTEDQRKKIPKSIQYSHRQLTRQEYSRSRLGCEQGLISMYAHYTILNMLRVWSNDGSSLFPLEKFGDCTLIVTLLRLLDYHYNYTRLHTDENVDRMSLLINSILKVEINELLRYQTTTHEILPHKAPVLYRLHNSIIVQSIQLLSNPSLLSRDYGDQSMINQPNFNFILKLVNLFVKLIGDKSTSKQYDVDILVPLLFPVPFIGLLFDLFLASSMYQSKMIILHSFSTLLQISPKFNLSRHIQHFLFRLFVELPPNPTATNSRMRKRFQIALMDLVYLLFEREKDQSITRDVTASTFGFDFHQFPQSFHDLLMVLDVINALTEKTKQTSFPEMFLLQSIVLLGDNLQLMNDEIDKSKSYFDRMADLQLMNFMNNHPLIQLSSAELISSLPTGSEPNPTYYKTCPSLWHIPAVYIQTRAKMFLLFSMCLEKLLAIIDLSLYPGQSILTDKIRTTKMYMLYPKKFQLLSTTLETTVQSGDDMLTVNFDTVRASTSDDHGLQTMFHQAYTQLHKDAHLTFRKSISQLWRAQYLDMHSTDQGGPYRDSISCVCADICSTRLSLFILCPNGRTSSGLNRDRWIPNVYPPNQGISNRVKKQYRFVGQLMGMAIRKKHYLDLKFPILLWKQLVRESITIEDIEAIDVQSFTMINEMEKTIKQTNQSIDTDSAINDLLSTILDELRFEAISSVGQTFELVPGGKDIPITASNFKEYCTSYREYRLNEFDRQIEFIRQGLYSVVPGYFLGLFTASELEEAVCGKGNMDVELLKRNTGYGGNYNQESPLIQRFWTVLGEMFTEEQKKLFLKFVWGRCTLPSCDDDFTSKFRIDSYVVSNGPVDGALPKSHTCSFVLDLPDYSSTDVMYDRLNYAITYCSSIDGDGSMNGPSDLVYSDSD